MVTITEKQTRRTSVENRILRIVLVVISDVMIATIILAFICTSMGLGFEALRKESVTKPTSGDKEQSPLESKGNELNIEWTRKTGQTSSEMYPTDRENDWTEYADNPGEYTDSWNSKDDGTATKEADKTVYTSEIVKTSNSYSSPYVAIQTKDLTKYTDGKKICYHVADVYIRSTESLIAGFPSDGSSTQAEKIMKENNAILGINGDYYSVIDRGIIVRNGMVYQSDAGSADICVLYRDGRMETFESQEFKAEDVIREDPWQVWNFGPALLDQNSKAKYEFNTKRNLLSKHPRTAIGYYEPGHYCFLVVDGRGAGGSAGIDMTGLSRLMEELGCIRAYNLDGGDSSCMVFGGKTISTPSGEGRNVSDMIMIIDGAKGENDS